MRKRIVINTYGSAGDLLPFFAIAQGLQARGHDVVIASDEISRPSVETAGFEFRFVRRSFPYGIESANELTFFNIRTSYDDLLAAVHGMDLLITHHLAFAGPLVASSTHIPWVSAALCPLTFASYIEPMRFVIPPGSPGFMPAVYNLHLSHMKEMRHSSHIYTAQVQWLRGELGLPQGMNVLFADHHSPNLVLALFSSAFATPLPDWPPQTRVTGFPFDPRLTGGVGVPPELDLFLDDGPPPIVFTLGSASIFDDGSFSVQSVLAANLLGRRAVLLGSALSGYLFPNNSNVISLEYAPHGEVFSRAAAVVHHGGIGTVAAAMRAGCPMLLLPGYSWDQPDNVARAVNLGIARMLPLDEYNAASAARELAHLLYDSSYPEKAGEIKSIVEAEDGVGSACDEIRRYLNAIK